MNPEEVTFEEFFAERMRQKGFSVKKLADTTGITARNLTDIVNGNFAAMPSAPYVRGYLIKLGEVLDFDGEAWWQRIKIERRVKNSGATDALPENRFLKKYPTKLVIGGIVIVIIIIYAAVQFPRIIGKPSLTFTDFSQNPFITNESTTIVRGTVKNADSLSIEPGNENIPIPSDGKWQKEISLSAGPQEITVAAKKFLGGTTEITEQIIYQPTIQSIQFTTTTSTASSSPSSSRN
jgi:cytoskeletal protein RodZ